MCGMRRTVVSKEARRKRIEGNVAMNGQEFYASQSLSRERAAAAPTQPGKHPEYATFDVDKPTPGEPEGERILLTSRSRTVSPPITGTGSDGSFTRSNTLTREPSDRSVGYGPPPRGAGPLSRPMPPGQVGNQYSNGALPTGAGVPPLRGGGYDRGYGGDAYGERGLSPAGFRGPTPPGMYPHAGGLAPPPRRGPSPGQFGHRPPPGNAYGGGGPGYGMGQPQNNAMMGPPPQGGMRGGQASYGVMGGPPTGVLMGGRGGPVPPPGPRQYDYPEGGIVDERMEFEKTLPMASAVGSMRGDERGGGPSGPGGPVELDTDERPSEPSHTGRLSVVNEHGGSTPQDEYIPPRQAWQQQRDNASSEQLRSPPPVELPAGSPSSSHSDHPPAPPTNVASSYYEDVVPAFDTTLPQNHPRSLTPGYPASPSSPPHDPPSFPPLPINSHRNPSNQTFEDLQDGQRSPAMSLSSGFTSISQRPPNPNWQPPPQQQHQQGRRGLTASQVLGGNPDFTLPGSGRGGQRGRGGGPVGMGR
ncbi:unnamed protein product [Tuber aestivum]|uniref:Uncharacterized protein n=1 Tax=Tuber aestivum TaxID=59557 RepID=A0A292Q7H3_9PEZI|nr:unnamed protein product [Tuber aestivum]